MAVFVLVPGAWLGGWCWEEVTPHLRAAGHDAVPVTLTGLGERAHLLGPGIGLDTHALDVAGVLQARDLRDVVLVGHSCGGTVVTAAAEYAAERIRCLAYLDACVPEDGQSNNDVLGPGWAERLRQAAWHGGHGWRVPPPAAAELGLEPDLAARTAPRLCPHPLASLEQPVRLRSARAAGLPRAFLRASPDVALYGRMMDRARAAGWHCRDLRGGHYPMLAAPSEVAAALLDLLLEERPA